MFHGSMVALVTPMFPDGTLDRTALDELIEYHIEQGTDAIVAMGTTGESATFGIKEHCEVIRDVVTKVNGRIPVIAGTGSNATQEAIELTIGAMKVGADACLLVTPYYNKPTQEGLFLHYKEVAEAAAIPQILYNVPGRTACDLLPETVERLSVIPNIIGIKEATGDIERSRDILARCGQALDIYSGDDATAMELMLGGAKGVISVTANVAPKLMHEMCGFALQGNRSAARLLNERLGALHRDLFVESNPIPVKWALYEMGLITEGIRLPMTVLSEQYHATIHQALIQSGVDYEQ
ncbi:MAG: 4-hydroxy-tetrahydrodipicolinate synthase [Gammaproteobacteria bacterium]|nr:4-hydroxy-tetrahydrodipicolinate synthase [Gammaproteobacteria bacterium]